LLSPLWSIWNFIYKSTKFLYSSGFFGFYFFNIFVLAENTACSLSKLSHTIITKYICLLIKTLLNAVIDFLRQLFANSLNLGLNISKCFRIIVTEYFINDCSDMSSEIEIKSSLALLHLISKLLCVGLENSFFDLLTSHAWKKDFLLRQIYIFVWLDGFPNILHVFREISNWYIISNQVFIFSTFSQMISKIFNSSLEVLFLTFL